MSTLQSPLVVRCMLMPETSVDSADFSLETFRHKLDEQGMSIAENQEQSVKSRKKLAETTRGTQADVVRLAVWLPSA